MTKVELDYDYLDIFPDRHGRERCYFRYRGKRWGALPLPGSPGFAEAYDARFKAVVTEGTLTPKNEKVAFIEGQLGWVIDQFLASDEYRSRSPMTKSNTRPILDRLREKYGAGLLKHLTPRHIKIIRNEITKEYSTSIAKTAIGLISTLWTFADEHLDLDIDANPTVGVSRGHKVKKEHEPWPVEVIERFTRAAPANLRLALMLALYTGQRRSDLIQMQWSQFDGKSIEVKQQKTGEPLTIPCHRALREALGIPIPTIPGTIITNAYRKPFSARGLTFAFYDVLRKLGIKGYSIHGLRKNAGVAMAEAGCTPHEIAAVLGHRTLRMVTLYTRRANQKRQATSAVEKWEQSAKPKNASGSN